jgi:ring-1,2-phenylacetyl-CoA epoxidase subunit PaaD
VRAATETDITAAVRAALQAVVDPEIPVLTIEDLGVLRDVTVGDDGRMEVTITPTYSGCPAMDTIRADVEGVLAEHGFAGARVRTVLAPAWTTDWMTEAGKRKLAEAGIAPPRRTTSPAPLGADPVPVELVRCPRCGSADTRLVSRFGSTACKALRACNRCLEPFDHFKTI